MADPIPTFKCIMLGDVSTGKTSFLKRHLNGEFQKVYIETDGAAVVPLIFHTNCGPMRFIVWDIAGHEKYSEMRESYCVDAKCAIIMCDIKADPSYENWLNWFHYVQQVNRKTPTVLIANKIDLLKILIWDSVRRVNDNKFILYNVSVKSKRNIEKPFLWLAQNLIGNPKLEFVAKAAPMPPAIKMNKDWKLEMAILLQKANEVDISEDDADL